MTSLQAIRTLLRVLCLALIAFVLSGCGYLSRWPDPVEAHTAFEKTLAARKTSDTLWADGWLRIERGGQSVFFSCEALIAYPDKLRMTVFGLFDRPEAYLTSNGQRVQIYAPGQERLYESPAEEGSFAAAFGLPPLKVSEMIAYLGGRVPAEKTGGAQLEKDRWNARWIVRMGSLALEERLYFNLPGTRLLGFERTVPGRKLTVDFSSYRTPYAGETSQPYPYRVDIRASEIGARLRATWRELEPGAAADEKLFTLKAPPGTITLPLSSAARLLTAPESEEESIREGEPGVDTVGAP